MGTQPTAAWLLLSFIGLRGQTSRPNVAIWDDVHGGVPSQTDAAAGEKVTIDMADFLASFDFGGGSSLFAPDDDACVSLDDFQQRLQHLIGSKTTATRAERVKATFDLAGSAQFTIAPTVDRNREADNVDPLLSGGEPTPAVREQVDQALVYKASDVLTSQAKDANQVRQTVAERIAAAAGRADTSTWLLYESKQDSYGCDFVFLCAHSTRVWCARNQKTPKSVVGDFTIKEPDSVNMGAS